MFSDLENAILGIAHKAMTQPSTLARLNEFRKLGKANLGNEGWFEWELYYWLLKENDHGWIRDKKNRKGANRRPGDGVDLQFNSGHFIEIKALSNETGTIGWVASWVEHEDADACVFLALRQKSVAKWMKSIRSNRFTHSKRSGEGPEFEVEVKPVNEDWIVGMMKLTKRKRNGA